MKQRATKKAAKQPLETSPEGSESESVTKGNHTAESGPVEEPINPKAEAAPEPSTKMEPKVPSASTEGAPEIKEAAPAKPISLGSLKFSVPPILLEGDKPASQPKTGQGEKFAVGGATPAKPSPPTAEQLPASYGTGRLTAIARDPRCLFVHWDFTDEQQRYYNSLSAHQHLVLRAHYGASAGSIAEEAHVQAETRHWFLHVPKAGTQYLAEIGYYQPDGGWMSVRTAEPITTQPDTTSEDQTVHFAFVAPATSQRENYGPVEPRADLGFPERSLAPEFHPTIKTPVLPESRPIVSGPTPSWGAVQEEALAELIGTMIRKERVAGSIELLELLQRQVKRQIIPFGQDVGLPGPSSAELGISSLQRLEELPSSLPGERLPPQKGFWFNVNAELIIYGATEPDATVTIGGRPIRLRPDGTFSYRFALPDGDYELSAAATPSDRSELRRADLRFGRQTDYSGEVGAHPQDRALRPPAPENVA